MEHNFNEENVWMKRKIKMAHKIESLVNNAFALYERNNPFKAQKWEKNIQTILWELII